MQSQESTNRQKFLAQHGINAKDQPFAVHTIQQVQNAAVQKIDEACVQYLLRWEPELFGKSPKRFGKWMREHDTIFSATSRHIDRVTGWHTLVYCFYRQRPVEKKRAMQIKMRITPLLGTGNVKLEVEHEEIPFPAEVKIKVS